MKNLPDKIYLSFGEMSEDRFEKSDYKELCEDSELVTFREFKFWNADVEYTRTDAFIDKACEWLRENKNRYVYNKGVHGDYIPTCSNKIIEDFKKYMKGE